MTNDDEELRYAILKILHSHENKYSLPYSIQELNEKVSEYLHRSFQGKKYTQFRNAIASLEKKEFIQLSHVGSTIQCQLTPVGSQYLLRGRYITFPPFLKFLVSYKYLITIFLIYAFVDCSYLFYLHRLEILTKFYTIWIMLLLLPFFPYLNITLLEPKAKQYLGISIKESCYDLEHPVIAKIIKHYFLPDHAIQKGIKIASFLSFVVTFYLYYAFLVHHKLNSIGFFNTPVNYSPISLLYNLLLFPFINWILITIFFLFFLTYYWLMTLPFIFPSEELKDLSFYLIHFYHETQVLLFSYQFLVVFLTSLALYSYTPYPYKYLLYLLFLISIASSILITFLFFLSTQHLHVSTAQNT